MSTELVQKILLACVPVYFYFIPEKLFPFLYSKFVKSSYYKIDEPSLGAYEEVQELKKSISRILEFIAFLSIVVLTIIATFYNKEHHTYFYQDCSLLALLILFTGLSTWVTYINVKKYFTINKFEKYMEKGILFFSMPLFFFWG